MNRDLILVTASLFTWGAGEGLFIYFQSLYLQKWGADPLQIGAILGGAGIAMALAQAPAGYLADRMGARPVMWAAWVLGCLATGLMAAANSLSVFVAGLLGYAVTAFVIPPMNSYITSVRGNLSIQRTLTLVSGISNLGAVLGPFVGGLIGERYGLPAVYQVAALIFILSTIIIFFIRKPPTSETLELEHPTAREKPNLLKNPRFAGLLALVSLTMFATYLPQPLTPIFLQNERGLSLQIIGQLGSLSSLGNAFLLLALGHLSAPVGLLVGQALVGVFALLIWQGNHTAWFSLGYFCLGGYRLARSMALAYACSLVNIKQTGLAYGLIETGNAIAVILAPLIAGVLYSNRPELVYVVSLAAIGLTILTNLFLLGGKRIKKESAYGA